MMVEIVYFAWIRERIGKSRETVTTDAATPRELVAELSARDDGYQAAFADLGAVRVAVDQELCGLDDSLENAKEVAFFPPMTGG